MTLVRLEGWASGEQQQQQQQRMAEASGRPLAPALSLRSTHSSTNASSRPASISRRNTSIACRECKRRRAKCSDGIPCTSCKQRGAKCTKNESDDGRKTRQIYKQKLEDLEFDQLLLRNLLRAIRTAGAEQLDVLIHLIRTDPPLRDISACIQSTFGSFEEEEEVAAAATDRSPAGSVADGASGDGDGSTGPEGPFPPRRYRLGVHDLVSFVEEEDDSGEG